MKTLFSTADLHPRDRFDRWHAAASANIIGHDAIPLNRLTFQAQLQAATLGEIDLVLFTNSPMDVLYDRSHIAQADIDRLLVCTLKSGVLWLLQAGNETRLEAGDLVLIDPAFPYTARFSVDSELLALSVGKRALASRIGHLQQLMGVKISPRTSDAILLSQYLQILPALAESLDGLTRAFVESHLVDLLAVTIATALKSLTPELSTTQLFVLLKLRRAVEDRAADPTLTVSDIAETAGVSVRYANAVLAEQGLSVRKLIYATRLARCRHALGDEQQINRSITEIALNWGFSDMTHFGRKFREAYDLLPSEYRYARTHRKSNS